MIGKWIFVAAALCAWPVAAMAGDVTMSVQNASPTLTKPADKCGGGQAAAATMGTHGAGAGSMTAPNAMAGGAVNSNLMASTADKCTAPTDAASGTAKPSTAAGTPKPHGGAY